MARVSIFLFLIGLVLSVIAVIDCLSTDEDDVRGLPKMFWVIIILLFSPVGPIAWFIAGRPRREKSTPQSWHPAGGGRGDGGRGGGGKRPRRVVAPDDDPEFLRSLDAKNDGEDDELMRKWEADLRRREDELRGPDTKGDPEKPDA